ncbi:MAG: cell division protein ZapA [Pseudomonas sp.]|uniref:cell division protein ZapA n=1 Tax=Pseudomonas sp. TaxID=306 RepID=UPI00299EBCC8|nr:cell division protein ZapA [Pseudomonas sp.]MDX1721586.1 cell division protein ZapA [Pseudomonas sp.]
MSGDGAAIKVISILGSDYSIKVPVGKEAELSASVLLLKRLLAETKAQSSTLIGERLLVLTALKLCAQQVELEQRHQQDIVRIEDAVSARVADIAGLIREG